MCQTVSKDNDERDRIAYHEAGHVLGYLAIHRRFKYVTIKPDLFLHPGAGGFIEASTIPDQILEQWPVQEQVAWHRGRAVIAVCGPKAEENRTGRPAEKRTAAVDVQIFDEAVSKIIELLPGARAAEENARTADAEKFVKSGQAAITAIAEELKCRDQLTFDDCLKIVSAPIKNA